MAAISGVAVGIVADASDPTRRGRVRVRIPAVSAAAEAWAPAVRAPGTRGSAYRAGDEVLVAFERGDARRPYVLGLLWRGTDAPRAQRR